MRDSGCDLVNVLVALESARVYSQICAFGTGEVDAKSSVLPMEAFVVLLPLR